MASNTTENALHIWRSRSIDSFARAEVAIDALSRKLNLPNRADMLSVKLDRLRKAKPGGGISTERKEAIEKALAELAELLPIRNDIAHSAMEVRHVCESCVARFSNPNVICEFSSFARELTAPRLRALASKAGSIAAKLENA